MALKKIGVRLVAENADKATKQVNKFNDSVEKTQKTAKSGGLSGFFSKATKSAKNFITNLKSGTGASNLLSGALSKLTSGLGSLGGGLSGALSQMTAFTGGIGAAIAATVALTAAMFKLGQRGAVVEQTQMAFSRVVGSVGKAEDVLASIRTQVRGTVSDMELMRLAITGLQGTSDLFRSQVLPNMGKIIDVTNRVATATGRSAEEIREKFITGLRRSSQLLVDDIGVTVDAAKANEEFARSIGKTASALTDQEKQAAFAAAAISQLDRIGDEVGGKTGGLVSMQQAMASVRNAIDTMGRVFKPVFELFATGIAFAANAFQKAANIIAPIVRSVVDIITELIKLIVTIGKVFLLPLAPIIAFGKTIGKWVIAILIVALDAMKAIVKFIREQLETAFKKISEFLGKIFGDTGKKTDDFILKMAEKLAYGGAFIIGAFATGILKGASFVLRAVNFIAGIVADFLEGLSPPKKGPLHNIDKGGLNVAKAWADGFVGGIRQPVSEAASFVKTALGNIASFSREQVEAALMQLDLSIRPFVEQLEIAKSRMEELAGFVDPAAKILERQRKNALKALLTGESTDTSKIINLDKQLVMLDKIKKAEQERVDQAELQARIAQADIARQKTLLLIQQKRLGDADKADKSAAAAGGAATGGAATEPIGTDGGFGGLGDEGEPFTIGSSSIADAVSKLKGALSKGASEGLAASGFEGALEGFNEQTGELQNNINRIKNSKPGQFVSNALSKIPEKAQEAIDNVKKFFSDRFEDIFGEDGIISDLASGIGDIITGAIDTIRNSTIYRKFDEKILTPIQNWFKDIDFPSLTEIVEFPINLIDSLFPDDIVSQVSDTLSNAASEIQTFFTDTLVGFLKDVGKIAVRVALVALFGGPLLILELGQKALELGGTIIKGVVDWIVDAATTVKDAFLDLIEDLTLGELALDIINAATGIGTAIIAGIVEAILGSAEALASAIASIMPDINIPLPTIDLGGGGPNSAGNSGATLDQDTLNVTADIGPLGDDSQGGARWTGAGNPNDPRGTYHAQESVIPRFGMIAANAPIRIVPTPQGPFLEGLQQFVSSLSGRMVNSPQSMPMQGTTNINNTTNNTTMQTTFNVPNQRSAIVMERQRVAGLNLG